MSGLSNYKVIWHYDGTRSVGCEELESNLSKIRLRAVTFFGDTNRGERMKYTRFEKARIIGARALQISMGAPVLIDVPQEIIDPIKTAEIEFNKGVIPITVKRG